jgi:hypothetical protein
MKIFQILHFAAGKAFCLISLGGASKGESAFIFFPLLCDCFAFYLWRCRRADMNVLKQFHLLGMTAHGAKLHRYAFDIKNF